MICKIRGLHGVVTKARDGGSFKNQSLNILLHSVDCLLPPASHSFVYILFLVYEPGDTNEALRD